MFPREMLQEVSLLSDFDSQEDKLYKLLDIYINLFPVRDAYLYRYSPIGYLCEGVIGISSAQIVHIRDERASIRSSPGFLPVLKNRKARIFTGIDLVKLMTSDYTFSSEIQSALVVPITTGQTIIGFILSYSIKENTDFNEELRHSLTTFGQIAGNLIDNLDVEHRTEVLSKRELEVMQRISWGDQTADIADALGISSMTVQQYIKSALKKLGTQNRAHAIAELFRKGIIR